MNFKVSVIIFLMMKISLTEVEDFFNFKNKMEDLVKEAASILTTIVSERCQEGNQVCPINSYNFCFGTSEKECDEDFPEHVSCMQNSLPSGSVSISSAIRFAEGKTINLTNEEKWFVCDTAKMTQFYQKVKELRKNQYTFLYIGSIYGSFRQYPSVKESEMDGFCKFYDPRGRPWYISAITGPKNIIIMIDVSGGMGLNKLDYTKEAAKGVINTLINVDFLAVIVFNETSQLLKYDGLKRATLEVRESLIEQIDLLEAGGTTNFSQAFAYSADTFKNAAEDEHGAPCQNAENVILFFSDGNFGQEQMSSEELIEQINEDIGQLKLTIYTYGLGQTGDTNYSLLKDISCAFNGIMFNVSEVQRLTKITQGYYQYISLSSNIVIPIWSEPYDDAFGFGKLFTVSIPIYYEGNGYKRIIGVAGLDILYKKMLSFGLDEQHVINKLITPTNNCPERTLSDCEREYYREDYAKCGVENCPIHYEIPTCNITISQEILQEPQSIDNGYCCSGNTSSTETNTTIQIPKTQIWIAAPIGLFALIGVCFVVYMIVKKVRENLNKKSSQKKEPNPMDPRNNSPSQNSKNTDFIRNPRILSNDS